MSLFALHVVCDIKAMAYDDTGAHCGACGLRWPMSHDGHGRPREYRQPRRGGVGVLPPLPQGPPRLHADHGSDSQMKLAQQTAPCPNCGNEYGPTQMQRREDGSWWCPNCHMDFGGPQR